MGRRVCREVAGEQQQLAGCVHPVVEGLRGRTAEDGAGPPLQSPTRDHPAGVVSRGRTRRRGRLACAVSTHELITTAGPNP